jgi:hypothetical protein
MRIFERGGQASRVAYPMPFTSFVLVEAKDTHCRADLAPRRRG